MALLAPASQASATDGWSEPGVVATIPLRTHQPGYLTTLSAPDGTEAVTWQEPIDSSTRRAELYIGMRPAGEGDWRLLGPVKVPRGGGSPLVVTPSSQFWIDVGNSGYVQQVSPTGFGSRFMGGPDGSRIEGYLTIGADGSRYLLSTKAPTAARESWVLVTAVKRPGAPWREYPLRVGAHVPMVNEFATNSRGDVAMVFLDSHDATTASLRVATLSHRLRSAWQVTTLAQDGDAHWGGRVSVGEDGTVAVAWDDATADAGSVQVAIRHIGGSDAWTTYQVAPAQAHTWHFSRPLVSQDGDVTVLWDDWHSFDGWGEMTLPSVYARQLHKGAWTQPAVEVSDPTAPAEMVDAHLLPNGDVAVLTHLPYENRFDFPNTAQSTTLSDGVPVSQETFDQTGNGWGEVALSVDGAGHQTVTWFGQAAGNRGWSLFTVGDGTVPTAMSAPFNGSPLTHARLTGKATVGHDLTCRSGYWVEAANVTYDWYRDGNRLHRASGDHHRVGTRDANHLLSCRVTAINRDGQSALESPSRTLS